MEVWKDIDGYEGRYQVSNFGRVKSLKFGKTRILNPLTDKGNYKFVILYKDKIRKPFTVHRLVAAAFVPNPDKLPQINHIDENKANNHVENLEWCDRKYNNNYGTRNKRAVEKLTNGKCSKKIDQFTLAGEFVRTWPSMHQIKRDLGIGNVSPCCKGIRKQAGNFVWRYHT